MLKELICQDIYQKIKLKNETKKTTSDNCRKHTIMRIVARGWDCFALLCVTRTCNVLINTLETLPYLKIVTLKIRTFFK